MTKSEFEILEALCGMWNQYCPPPWTHHFMSAGEGAEDVLRKYSLLKDDQIDWDKLEEYRKEVSQPKEQPAGEWEVVDKPDVEYTGTLWCVRRKTGLEYPYWEIYFAETREEADRLKSLLNASEGDSMENCLKRLEIMGASFDRAMETNSQLVAKNSKLQEQEKKLNAKIFILKHLSNIKGKISEAQKAIIARDRLQDIFHSNTEAVMVENTPIIVLRSETFEKVFDLLLHEMLPEPPTQFKNQKEGR